MNEPRESDWKKFRAKLEVWRERYLTEKNPRLAAMLTDPKKTETERFWDAEHAIEKEARVLQRCLDDIRRSRMLERLWEMRAAKMIRREDLAEFSQELQDHVFFESPKRESNSASVLPQAGTMPVSDAPVAPPSPIARP